VPIKDGDWELIEYEPALKRSLWSYYDGEKMHFRHTYEVGAILTANKQQQADNINKKWGEWRKVASIPSGLFFNDLGEAVRQKDENYVKKYLNDADNRNMRTFLGNV
jgi:hypothetical protein